MIAYSSARGGHTRYLTASQAADCLGLTRQALLDAVERGELRPSYRASDGRYRFRPQRIAAYARQRGAPRSPTLDATQQGAIDDTDALLRRAYAALTSGVIVFDPELRVLAANAAAEEILGLVATDMRQAGDDLFGARVFRLNGDPLPLDDHPEMIALRSRQPVYGVMLLLARTDGERRHLKVDAVPLIDASGTLERVVVSYIDLTACVRAEDERDRFFDLAHDSMCIIDSATGYLVRVNAACIATLGWTRDELMARPFIDFTHPDDHAATLSEVAKVYSGSPSTNFETRWLHKDGSWRWLSWNASPTTSTGLVYTIGRDVTEQRRATEALRLSEERLRQMELHAPTGVALATIDGHWVRVNPALCRLLGYSEEEILRLSWQDLTHPDDLEADRTLADRMLAGEVADYQLEKRYCRKDGSLVWILLAVSLLRDEAGMPLYFISQIQDIDARKTAETALRESEAHYRLLADNATDMISRHRPDGSFLYVSPAYQTLLGRPRDEIARYEMFTGVHPDDQASVHASYGTLLAGADQCTTVYRVRHADGHYLWFESIVRAVRDPQTGALTELQCASRDISARKEAEERLQTIVAHAPIALTAIDTRGVVTFSSGRGVVSLESGEVDAVGRSIFEMLATMPVVLEHVRHALTGESSATTISVGERILETSFTPLRDADDQVSGAVGVSVDITERVHAEEERRASDARFRQLVELAQEGIWQIDLERRTTYVNRRMADLLGYTPAEMLGRSLQDFTDEEGAALLAEAMTLYPNGHAQEHECKFLRKDKTALWTLYCAAYLYDTHGQKIGSFATVTDITARKYAQEQLRYLAEHDALTGLPNRTVFADRFAQALLLAERRSEPLTVLMLDLDRFKWVNDTLGHAAGDQLLCVVADRLRSTTRTSDTIARLGGDEFALVLTNTDEQGALVAAEKILNTLAEPVPLREGVVDIGGSIGIALYPIHGTSRTHLLRCADIAMYRAKRTLLGCALFEETLPPPLSHSA